MDSKRDFGASAGRLALGRLAFGVAFGVTLSFPLDAAASKVFPGKIQSTLNTRTLDCTLCHLTTQGGPGRIDENKHFADAILRAGVVVGAEDSIPGALARMETQYMRIPDAPDHLFRS